MVTVMGSGVSARAGGNSRKEEAVSADAPKQMGFLGMTRRKGAGGKRRERVRGGGERKEDWGDSGVCRAHS